MRNHRLCFQCGFAVLILTMLTCVYNDRWANLIHQIVTRCIYLATQHAALTAYKSAVQRHCLCDLSLCISSYNEQQHCKKTCATIYLDFWCDAYAKRHDSQASPGSNDKTLRESCLWKHPRTYYLLQNRLHTSIMLMQIVVDSLASVLMDCSAYV
jgi:hypothetical protein